MEALKKLNLMKINLQKIKRDANAPTRQGKTLFDLRRSLLVGSDAWRALRGGPPAIEARQKRRLADLIAFARERSPYLRELYAGLPQGISDLSLLPPTEKATLMENFDGWVTDPALRKEEVEAFLADKSLIGRPFLGRYLVWTSSGTSGIPVILVADKQALAVMAAMGVARGPGGPRDFLKVASRGNRQAGVYGAGGHMHGTTIMEHMRDHPKRAKKFTGFSVLTPLPELVRRLNEFRPAVLGGYASTLLLLAEEQAAGRLRIDPALILSGGEVLTPEARERMASAFGCPVRDYYGAAEAAGLSYDCEYGRLHLNADWFVLEPVDEDYQPVGPGEVSHTVLLTNLANRVQPIIRYDLGDRITMNPEPCPCGSPLPTLWVEGRRNELISFQKDDGEAVKLPPRALAMAMDSTPGVHRCQAIKSAPAGLKIRLEVDPTADEREVFEEARRRLREYLSAQGLPSVSVERDRVGPSIDPKTGKFRHVWSEVEEEAQATTW